MFEQVIAPAGRGEHLIARDSLLFRFSSETGDLVPLELPAAQCDCSFGFVAASAGGDSFLAVDILGGSILRGGRDFRPGGGVGWRITDIDNGLRKPWSLRSVAFAHEHIWGIAADDSFRERLIRCSDDEDALFRDGNCAVESAFEGRLYGYTALFGTRDYLITADLTGRICWWDESLKLVVEALIEPDAVAGQAHDGRILTVHREESVFKVKEFRGPNEGRSLIGSSTAFSSRARGVSLDARGGLVVVDWEYGIYLKQAGTREFDRVPVDWARVAAEAIIRRSVSRDL